MIEATVIADSIGPTGIRLTTLSLVYPRFILAEFNTHRMFSRNSASSRAIPTRKLIEMVKDNPVIPVEWGRNQPGMQASEQISDGDAECASKNWLLTRDCAVLSARKLATLGVHKQVVNRILEPFMHVSTVVTATDWDNFFTLRRHKDAQPEIRMLADCMFEAMKESKPREKNEGDWHLPYCDTYAERIDNHSGVPVERILDMNPLEESVARCARVSYLTHEGKRSDIEADKLLYQSLLNAGHWSPFEHQARAIESTQYYGNFQGWKQYRQILGEYPGSKA